MKNKYLIVVEHFTLYLASSTNSISIDFLLPI
jgi:hypothetical protein